MMKIDKYDTVSEEIITLYVNELRPVREICALYPWMSRGHLGLWLKERGLLRKAGQIRNKPAPHKTYGTFTCELCQTPKTKTAPGQRFCKECMPDFATYGRLRYYGLTPAQFKLLLENQRGECVCGKRFSDPDVKMHIDHDHETGRVRGLLCNQCNVCIGMAGNSSETLRQLASYVDKSHMIVSVDQSACNIVR